jgi:ABC-type branched-subunit amino acid transport system ATPase component
VRAPDGRALFGVVGRAEYGPLGDALRRSGLRWRPAVSLSLLGAAAALQLTAFGVLGARIALALDIGSSLILLLVALGGMAAGGAGAIRAAESGVPRSSLALGAGAAAAVALALTGLASGFWQLGLCLALGGAATGAAFAVHGPLLMDHYRPEVRLRMFSLYWAGITGGMAVAAASAVLATGALTWRGVFLVLAVVAGAAVVLAAPLRDRRPGSWDSLRLRRAMGAAAGADAGTNGSRASVEDDGPAVGTVEELRQVLGAPATRLMMLAVAFWGSLAVGNRPYLLLWWEQRWGADGRQQAWLYALACVGAVVGLALSAKRAEIAWRVDPGHLLVLARNAGMAGGVCVVLSAVVPGLYPSLVFSALGFGAFAVLLPAVTVAFLAVVRPQVRPHASLVIGLALLTGAILGQQSFAAVGARFGVRWILVLSGVVGAYVLQGLHPAARQVDAALDATIHRLTEEEQLRLAVGRGAHVPLLTCRAVDFSYGQLQVLFDVNFSVDAGEMVALLGTNGAGKSTLLRVISGLGIPTRGSIHLQGNDVTYLDASQRVALGISQVPGGRAVFGPMSVVDNLRVFGYSHGRDRAAVERGIDTTFETFPRLAERRHQLAATLSGGEQQMLALGKALILRPRVLLIDELSLGLAPNIVAQLFGLVRRINAEGTAVVLVEQSVNAALALVDHAYFMEKGEIRFDGRAADLIERPDLLRSVFLEGARAAT